MARSAAADPPQSAVVPVERPDVLVLGGGPAGLASAIRARVLGAKVLVVSRRAESLAFRPGERLPPEADGVLRELGVREAVGEVALRHQGTWVRERGRWAFVRHRVAPGGCTEGLSIGGGVLHAILKRRAEALGVAFSEGSAEHLDRDGGAFRGLVLRGGRVLRAGFLVDATGTSRWLARQLGRASEVSREPYFSWLDPEPNDTPPRLAFGGGAWLVATPLAEVGTRHYASFPRPGARALSHVVHAAHVRGEGFVSVGAAWASAPLLEGGGWMCALRPPSLDDVWFAPPPATAGPSPSPSPRRARRTRCAA